MSNSENEQDFAKALAEYEGEVPMPGRQDMPAVGDQVRGRVVNVGREAVFVALGGKAEAVLDLDQVIDGDGQVKVKIGDEVEARVAEIRSGQIILRTTMGRGPDARSDLKQAFDAGIPVDGVVGSAIKGGVEVQIAGMRAFCPISQLDTRFIEDPSEFVGQKLSFRIIRYEDGRGRPNIVLSRRALLEEEAKVRAAETRATLHEGAVMAGKVTTIKAYGAFVDLGGIEGMIHISELGYSRVEHPGDVLAVGQTVEVQVIRVEKTGDPKRPEKIGLSLKALARDPWEELRPRLDENARITGKVVRLQQFGAFVELAPGVEGLVHISQMASDRRINHPGEVVSVGDEVEVAVLSVDDARRRISLSISAVASAEEASQMAEYRPPKASGSGLGTFADLLEQSQSKKKRRR